MIKVLQDYDRALHEQHIDSIGDNQASMLALRVQLNNGIYTDESVESKQTMMNSVTML